MRKINIGDLFVETSGNIAQVGYVVSVNEKRGTFSLKWFLGSGISKVFEYCINDKTLLEFWKVIPCKKQG